MDKSFNHFKNLLGSPPVSVGVDLDADNPDILLDLDTEDGPFSMEELT